MLQSGNRKLVRINSLVRERVVIFFCSLYKFHARHHSLLPVYGPEIIFCASGSVEFRMSLLMEDNPLAHLAKRGAMVLISTCVESFYTRGN